MAITLDGTTGITTPGLTNTGTETIVNLTSTGNTTLGDATSDTLTVGVTGIVKDASGNVGIGTASPKMKLNAEGTYGNPVTSGATPTGIARFSQTTNNVTLDFGVTTGNRVWMQGADKNDLSFTYDVVINPNGGNVGIGTSSPAGKLDVSQSTAGVARHYLRNTSNSVGAYTILDLVNDSGNNIGEFFCTSSTNTSAFGTNATVLQAATSNPLILGTNGTERMRIDSSGNVTVANGTIQTTATADATVGFQLIKVSSTVTAGTNKYIQFLTNNGAASTGFIASNGASNAGFFAGSDRRIKTDIQALADGVEKVMQLKPSKFKFKENDEKSHGFIAQELNEVFPECVYKPNDGEGSELQEGQEPWAINLDKLIPYLTAAIQEQQALITALTARITALETP